MTVGRARTRRFTTMLVVAMAMVTAGCATPVAGEPRPRQSAEDGPERQPRQPGSYQYVAGLCEQLDFGALDALSYIADRGGSDTHTPGSPYSATNCRLLHSGPGETRGNTSLRIEYLPDPAVGPGTYEQHLEQFRDGAKETSRPEGDWEQAELAIGDGVHPTAVRMLMQDGNLCLRLDVALDGLAADDQVAGILPSIADEVRELSAT
ncbi:hypothetical protein BAY61_15965 [Prauserella marina]|uniref:Uncharacterized protein n=1 Tax=Prauserella marina TaxID=530584 RepID=A0A222VR86_9PSEU|nr:hypothetical protein [Prauserella marina]ASR36253.1 hypothetical protein BAY61_15965 [Prauserella marina]PWV77023.1 hypothetical protein DES30_105240 [Prauserella marina]SDD02595.1 hypothetical protein SAMN05421630_105241 [Prauserella marina]